MFHFILHIHCYMRTNNFTLDISQYTGSALMSCHPINFRTATAVGINVVSGIVKWKKKKKEKRFKLRMKNQLQSCGDYSV